MGNDKLSVADALKFARHDFMNDLQLILLYIDLGKIPEAKKTILDATASMRQMAMLEKLGLPTTTMWLSTFDWKYSEFSATMTCNIKPANRNVDDASLADYLEQVFKEAEKALDATSEYEAHITVNASQMDWSINIIVNGVMDNLCPAPAVTGDFTVEETILHNQWTFTVSGR